MKIVIINYGAGNTQSVIYAVERIGYKAHLSNNFDEILNADRIIFPGVGRADYAMESLKNNKLDKLIPLLKQPVLGICLGMQLMCSHSEEGHTNGLGIFPVSVKRFENSLKVPQVGWNKIIGLQSELFDGIKEETYMYFVHSYYVAINEWTIATTTYGIPYAAAVRKNNFYGCQFHPEKSSDPGTLILENFIKNSL